MFAADGRMVWFHDEAHLICDGEGHPVVWQGVMVDITERQRGRGTAIAMRRNGSKR